MKSYRTCTICGQQILYVSGPATSSKFMVEHLQQHVKDLIDNKSKKSGLTPLFEPVITLFGWEFVRADSGDEIYGIDQKGYLYTLKRTDLNYN